uniref:Uncharacterized protein n=1 Tax=Steinernema glaseri TaxID=37863 RepID=A0A1I7ZKZ7_9BILA
MRLAEPVKKEVEVVEDLSTLELGHSEAFGLPSHGAGHGVEPPVHLEGLCRQLLGVALHVPYELHLLLERDGIQVLKVGFEALDDLQK